jgi:hypothetical protein
VELRVLLGFDFASAPLCHHLIFGFVDFPFPVCENPPKRPLCGGNGKRFPELKQRFR